MICEYDAADVASVRNVQREAEAKFDRAWAADVLNGDEPRATSSVCWRQGRNAPIDAAGTNPGHGNAPFAMVWVLHVRLLPTLGFWFDGNQVEQPGRDEHRGGSPGPLGCPNRACFLLLQRMREEISGPGFSVNRPDFARSIKDLFLIGHLAVRILPSQPASAVSANSGPMNCGYASKQPASC